MTFPKTPAARMELLTDLYAPLVEDEDGFWFRDPECGVITREQFIRLLTMPVDEEPS